MKRYFIYIFASSVALVCGTILPAVALSSDELKDAIVPRDSYGTVRTSWQGEDVLDYVFAFARDSIFALMAVIAIGMFLYIGARLIVARGNQEEFQKALKSFAYAVVGILFVAFAWALINFVVGLDF